MNYLKELRKTNNVKVSTLAELIGLKTLAAYYKKESGSVKFTVEEAIAIAEHIGKPVEEIFLPDEFPERNGSDEPKVKPKAS